MSEKVKVLVNGITLDNANLVPLIKKIRFWKSQKARVTVIGTQNLKSVIPSNLYDSYINIGRFRAMGGGYSFIVSSLIRNIHAARFVTMINQIDTVYTISSVLDQILLPYYLRTSKKVNRWVTVFDNTVPLFSGGKLISGNIIIRFLAYIFFQFSLFFLKRADTIFVVKTELRDYLVRRGFDHKKIVVTGNGVEQDYISKAKASKKYKFDGLFVGRINEAKGIYDLLNVVKIVKKEIPSFKLAIMGLGDTETVKKYKSKIKEMNLAKNLDFLGFVTGQKKYDIIKSCKIFLFLSQTESLPVAPLEAVCSGKITLVYDLDAYKMYKNNEVLRFNQGDFESVADKVVEIMKSGSFVNLPGERLLKKFSWDTIAKTEFASISEK